MKHHRLDADLPVAVRLLPFGFHLTEPARIHKPLIGRIAAIQHARLAQEGKEAVAANAAIEDFGDSRHINHAVAAGNVVVELHLWRVFRDLHLQRQPLLILRRPCPCGLGGVGKIGQGGRNTRVKRTDDAQIECGTHPHRIGVHQLLADISAGVIAAANHL